MAKWKQGMSPEERGENLRFDRFEFPSIESVTGTGYRLHAPPYTKEEQLVLLENNAHGGTLWEALHIYCDGNRDRVGEIFSITQNEYLQWAQTQPIERFVALDSAPPDFYFLAKVDGGWELRYQERWSYQRCETFRTKEEAKEYAIRHLSPFRVFDHLAR